MSDNKVSAIFATGDENNGNNNGSGIRSIIFDYAERTTFHGIRYFIVGGNVARRLIWFAFVLSSFLYSTYNCIRLIDNYLDHPTMTKQKIITQRNMVFPAVTICNYNPVRKGKHRPAEVDMNQKPIRTQSEVRKKLVIDNLSMELDKLYQTYGHNMDEDGMFVECKWKGKPCGAKDFRPSVQSIGLCHTFNSGYKNYSLQNITNAGETSGLLLTLNVQLEDYQPDTESVGVKVLIHDQDEPIFIKEGGFAVMPGRKALVSVTKKQVKTPQPPYGQACVEEKSHYSKTLCMSTCKEEYIIQNCKCQRPPKRKNNVKVCSRKEVETCCNVYEEKFSEKGMFKNCSCLDSCEKTTYETDLSYAFFQQIPNTTSLHNQFASSIRDSNTSAKLITWLEFLGKNVLQLAIYMNDLKYIRIEVVQAYSWESFAAEFGGTIGLCLGASLLTIVELMDLFCYIAVLLFKKLMKNMRINDK